MLDLKGNTAQKAKELAKKLQADGKPKGERVGKAEKDGGNASGKKKNETDDERKQREAAQRKDQDRAAVSDKLKSKPKYNGALQTHRTNPDGTQRIPDPKEPWGLPKSEEDKGSLSETQRAEAQQELQTKKLAGEKTGGLARAREKKPYKTAATLLYSKTAAKPLGSKDAEAHRLKEEKDRIKKLTEQGNREQAVHDSKERDRKQGDAIAKKNKAQEERANIRKKQNEKKADQRDKKKQPKQAGSKAADPLKAPSTSNVNASAPKKSKENIPPSASEKPKGKTPTSPAASVAAPPSKTSPPKTPRLETPTPRQKKGKRDVLLSRRYMLDAEDEPILVSRAEIIQSLLIRARAKRSNAILKLLHL